MADEPTNPDATGAAEGSTPDEPDPPQPPRQFANERWCDPYDENDPAYRKHGKTDTERSRAWQSVQRAKQDTERALKQCAELRRQLRAGPAKLTVAEQKWFQQQRADEERRDPSKRRDLVDDIEWALDHLDDETVLATDAPGPKAWTILWQARSNRTKFFDKQVPLLAARDAERRKKAVESVGEVSVSEARDIAWMTEEIRKAVEAAKKEET